MSKRERILDDIARVAGGTVGVLNDVKSQAGQTVRSCVDSMAQDMDLVAREDFENLELVVEALREKVDTMQSRIDELEGQLSKG